MREGFPQEVALGAGMVSATLKSKATVVSETVMMVEAKREAARAAALVAEDTLVGVTSAVVGMVLAVMVVVASVVVAKVAACLVAETSEVSWEVEEMVLVLRVGAETEETAAEDQKEGMVKVGEAKAEGALGMGMVADMMAVVEMVAEARALVTLVAVLAEAWTGEVVLVVVDMAEVALVAGRLEEV